MIKSIKSLQGECEECGTRADFCVERTNDELPHPYVQSGTRYKYYCTEHMPQDAKASWNFASGGYGTQL